VTTTSTTPVSLRDEIEIQDPLQVVSGYLESWRFEAGDASPSFDESDLSLASASCSYPIHELLTYLVVEHGLLLHGSNDANLSQIDPQPASDYDTELMAVVACDDGIWPIFYAVLDRRQKQVDNEGRADGSEVNVFTACTHLGRTPRLRRFYMFAIFGADPHESTAPGRKVPSTHSHAKASAANGATNGSATFQCGLFCESSSAQRTSHSGTPYSQPRTTTEAASTAACARQSAGAATPRPWRSLPLPRRSGMGHAVGCSVAKPGDELVNSMVNFASSIECRSVVSEHQFMRNRHAR
jgi:hypothetical protein